jgi:hypothetical protein
MSRRRAWISRCTPVVLALFLGTSALPRASVYMHHHPGGEHEHVHAWGADPVSRHHDHDHDEHHHHPHGVHATHDHAGRLAIEADDDGPSDHVHWQPPFQRTARPQVPRVVRVVTVALLAPSADANGGFVPTVPTSARAPPSLIAAADHI